jgi:hypothetical protein
MDKLLKDNEKKMIRVLGLILGRILRDRLMRE